MSDDVRFEYLAKLGVPAATIDQLRVATQARCQAAPPAPAPQQDKLPQPMQSDCKVVRGQVPGPANHVLCATHGHVLDLAAKTIIAHSVDEYKKLGIAKQAKAAADAEKARAVAEKKHGELEKQHGNIQVDISLLVHGVYGPKGGLKVSVIAHPDHGAHTEEVGVATFKDAGGGKYLALKSWLPRGGFMEFNVLSGGKQHIEFKPIQFPCPDKGFLRLEATEKPKTSSVSTSRTIENNYSQSGTFESSFEGIGGSATFQTGGAVADSTGLSDNIEESSGEFDVRVV